MMHSNNCIAYLCATLSFFSLALTCNRSKASSTQITPTKANSVKMNAAEQTLSTIITDSSISKNQDKSLKGEKSRQSDPIPKSEPSRNMDDVYDFENGNLSIEDEGSLSDGNDNIKLPERSALYMQTDQPKVLITKEIKALGQKMDNLNKQYKKAENNVADANKKLRDVRIKMNAITNTKSSEYSNLNKQAEFYRTQVQVEEKKLTELEAKRKDFECTNYRIIGRG